MSSIRITIGAGLDPSVAATFAKIDQVAARSYGRMRDTAGRASKGTTADAQAAAAKQTAIHERAAEAHAKALERANAKIARLESQSVSRAERTAQAKLKAEQRALATKERATKKAYDAEERDILRVAAAAERADARMAASAAKKNGLNRAAFSRSFGHASVSNMGRAARFGMGVAGQMARGAGVNLDIGTSVGRNIELETKAVELSNLSAEYKDNRLVSRRDAGEITGKVKEAADANAFSRVETMEGLHQFAAKTGDVSVGMDIMKDLGALSRATGTDLGDMVSAAGDVSIALGEMGSKAEKVRAIQGVMATFAGQGKEAAVEIKDLAKQMAKLSASASGFEGNREDILAMMGTFAQMSRQAGGSASSTQAATSVQGLVNTLKTPARAKAFLAEGIEVSNKETGLLRNPQEIIKAALAKTEGDTTRMKSMFANVIGARAVEGFSNTYRNARADSMKGGATGEAANAAGLKAVQAAFDKFNGAKIGQREIDDAAAQSMNTDAARVQKFNNRIDDIVLEMQTKLSPALERAAPGLIKLADSLATAIAWAAENPGKMIALAVVASIAKAGLSTVIASALASMFEKQAAAASASSLVSGGPGKGGGMASKGLALGAAAVVGFGLGSAMDSADADAEASAEAAQRRTSIEARNARHKLHMAVGGPNQAQALAEAQGVAAGLEKKIGAEDPRNAIEQASPIPNFASAALNWVTSGSSGKSLEAQAGAESDANSKVQNIAELVALKVEMATLKASMDANKSAVDASANKIVTAIVASGRGGPGVDPSGRQPAPSP